MQTSKCRPEVRTPTPQGEAVYQRLCRRNTRQEWSSKQAREHKVRCNRISSARRQWQNRHAWQHKPTPNLSHTTPKDTKGRTAPMCPSQTRTKRAHQRSTKSKGHLGETLDEQTAQCLANDVDIYILAQAKSVGIHNAPESATDSNDDMLNNTNQPTSKHKSVVRVRNNLMRSCTCQGTTCPDCNGHSQSGWSPTAMQVA